MRFDTKKNYKMVTVRGPIHFEADGSADLDKSTFALVGPELIAEKVIDRPSDNDLMTNHIVETPAEMAAFHKALQDRGLESKDEASSPSTTPPVPRDQTVDTEKDEKELLTEAAKKGFSPTDLGKTGTPEEVAKDIKNG